VARALHKEESKQKNMNPINITNKKTHESTYALLVRSEEKQRSLFETITYGIFILSSVAAIAQFALQPVNLPLNSATRTVSTTQSNDAVRG